MPALCSPEHLIATEWIASTDNPDMEHRNGDWRARTRRKPLGSLRRQDGERGVAAAGANQVPRRDLWMHSGIGLADLGSGRAAHVLRGPIRNQPRRPQSNPAAPVPNPM